MTLKNLSPSAQKEWNRFIDSLKVHEGGHVKITNDFYTKAAKDVIGKKESEARNIIKDATQQEREAQKTYDANTDHGVTQGAKLNIQCDIKC